MHATRPIFHVEFMNKFVWPVMLLNVLQWLCSTLTNAGCQNAIRKPASTQTLAHTRILLCCHLLWFYILLCSNLLFFHSIHFLRLIFPCFFLLPFISFSHYRTERMFVRMIYTMKNASVAVNIKIKT